MQEVLTVEKPDSTSPTAGALQVPFFRYPHIFESSRAELIAAFERVASAGAFILQDDVREFERALADFCGARYAIGVGNATDGIELILRALEIGHNDEVIIASHTFVATAAAVVSVGATPVFADIGEDHLLDPDDAVLKITRKTRAIMPTQLNGRTAAMERFEVITREAGIHLLEDSAQGLGSRYRGQMAGTFGAAGVYSFYPAKTLGALGDAGAIITNDEVLARALGELRDHGRSGAGGDVFRWGKNSRLDNLQAAFLRVKLRSLGDEIARRREIARRYDHNLGGVAQLLLPPPPDCDPAHHDVFQNYEIEADERDGLRAYLALHGIGTIVQWGGKGVHQFADLGITATLPRTERMFERALLLPMNTSVTDNEIDYICDRISAFYARR